MHRPILLVVASIFFAGCAPQESATASEADRAAVEEASRAITVALNGDDIDGIVAGLTLGHVSMTPNEPILPNGPGLRSWHEARIAAAASEFEFTTESIIVTGDWAIQRFRAEITATPRDGSPSTNDSLKGVWVWQRQSAGDWKLDLAIWNSDNPVETG